MSFLSVSVTACGSLGLGKIDVDVVSGICSDVSYILPTEAIVWGDDVMIDVSDRIFNAQTADEAFQIMQEFLAEPRDILTPSLAGQIEVHNTFLDKECEQQFNAPIIRSEP